MARRGENIHKRKDGRWEGRYIKARTPDRRICWGYIYGTTYAEVKQRLIHKKSEYGGFQLIDAHLTFTELAEAWLQSVKCGLKESTCAHYQYTLYKYVLPILGTVPISRLEENILEQALQKIIAPPDGQHRELGFSSARECLSMVRRICKYAVHGFRGEAGITLTADHAYKVGRFLGWYYNALRERNGDNEPARIVIGKDTRRSSYMFEYSLVAGLTASGADAYLLHVTTTPSVAYIARVDDFDCGIMISASHNPYYDNGIKLIDCYGEKMPEETLLLVEDYIDGKLHVFDQDWPELPFAHREHIGCTVDYVAGRNRYMGYLISLGIYSFKVNGRIRAP